MQIDLHQSRELEICIRSRDGDLTTLSGLLYLRLEDYFDTNSMTYCLPLEPQGILLAEITYEIPRTERRQPKLKRGRRIFRRMLITVYIHVGRKKKGVYVVEKTVVCMDMCACYQNLVQDSYLDP